MTERKFARGLTKAGTAALVRETVSQVVRESAVLVSVVVNRPTEQSMDRTELNANAPRWGREGHLIE